VTDASSAVVSQAAIAVITKAQMSALPARVMLIVVPYCRDYLTEIYSMYMQMLITWNQAYIDLDKAFAHMPQNDCAPECAERLNATLKNSEEVQQQGRAVVDM
jgi:hypothetical protein